MTDRIRIQCITKPDRNNPFKHIEGIGGLNENGTPWWLSLENAISGMEQRPPKWAFYVSEANRTVDVVIEQTSTGHKFLKTHPDGVRLDNLLSLKECP